MSVGHNKKTNAFEIEGVGRQFGAFWAIKDVSFCLGFGERLAILGPNGAGKTTLFNILTGNLTATTGKIMMNGSNITNAPVQKRIKNGLRRTYQHAHLFDGLTVMENLFLSVAGIKGRWLNILPLSKNDAMLAKAESLAIIAGLENFVDQKVSNLSHGQKRQLEIGMALAEDPKILLLDEPAAGLSPSERPKLTELLLSLPKEISYILIEHDMDIALKTSDSVIVLHNGELLAKGKPDDIMSNERVHEVYMGGAHEH